MLTMGAFIKRDQPSFFFFEQKSSAILMVMFGSLNLKYIKEGLGSHVVLFLVLK